MLTDVLIPVLQEVRDDEQEAGTQTPTVSPERSRAWSGADTFTKNASTGGSTALQRLIEEARVAFEVDMATVTLLEGTTLWCGVHTNVFPASGPRDLTYSDTAAATDGPLIVPDSRTDPRFQDNSFIEISGSRFYAGHPIRSSTGEAIGTFCLHNARTRPASTVSTPDLERFARCAETELHTYEHSTAPQQRQNLAPTLSLRSPWAHNRTSAPRQ